MFLLGSSSRWGILGGCPLLLEHLLISMATAFDHQLSSYKGQGTCMNTDQIVLKTKLKRVGLEADRPPTQTQMKSLSLEFESKLTVTQMNATWTWSKPLLIMMPQIQAPVNLD
jgi:hypothetical protein